MFVISYKLILGLYNLLISIVTLIYFGLLYFIPLSEYLMDLLCSLHNARVQLSFIKED